MTPCTEGRCRHGIARISERGEGWQVSVLIFCDKVDAYACFPYADPDDAARQLNHLQAQLRDREKAARLYRQTRAANERPSGPLTVQVIGMPAISWRL